MLTELAEECWCKDENRDEFETPIVSLGHGCGVNIPEGIARAAVDIAISRERDLELQLANVLAFVKSTASGVSSLYP